MNQAVGAGKNFYKRAKVDDFSNRPFIDLADLRLGSDFLDHLDGLPRSLFIAGSNGHRAVVFNIHLDAGRFNDPADHFAARADYFADFFRPDFDRDNAGSMSRNGSPVRGKSLVHDTENVEPPFLRLTQRLAHDVAIDSAQLDIHLQ